MILVLNCGSQSIKWKLYDKSLTLLKEKEISVLNSKEFEKTLKEELNLLKENKISYIGHRVVHGGEKYTKTTLIDKGELKKLESFNYLAPLHNPFNTLGISICMKVFPEAKEIAVFDTEFYSDLPKEAYTYALSLKVAQKKGYRKFGFHGISHEYASKQAAKEIKKPYNKLKIISCHLGGGSSVSAISKGKAVETSMGYTPLDGLAMMTRCGDVDPGIVLDLLKDNTLTEVKHILNKESGLYGICGKDNMLAILEEVKKDNKKAQLALDIYTYRIKKYIGAYYAVMGGCDLIVFTGTIGYRSSKIRNMILNNLPIKAKDIEIKPDEELAIAQKIVNFRK
jgi:acetate kinase